MKQKRLNSRDFRALYDQIRNSVKHPEVRYPERRDE